MPKRVVIVASGATERAALPNLLGFLASEDIEVRDVRTPPRHRGLTVDVARAVVRAAWFELRHHEPPQKFVILVDADGGSGQQAISRLDGLEEKLADLPVPVKRAAAKWHLEAWFFADEQGLRRFLGTGLGSVNSTAPDSIENPKHHLKNLLAPRLYTSRIAGEMSAMISGLTVRARSPSFQSFVEAIRNGSYSPA